MTLKDFSRYAVYNDGDRLAVCDTEKDEVVYAESQSGYRQMSLFSDDGKRHTLTERRIKTAIYYGVSPISFKLPYPSVTKRRKEKDFVLRTIRTAKAVKELQEGNLQPITEDMTESRQHAIRMARGSIGLSQKTASYYADIAEERLIDILRSGHFASLRPTTEMMASLIVKLYQTARNKTTEYKDIKDSENEDY